MPSEISQPMKIALATSMSGLGGTETATLRLGKLLLTHQHNVILAASDGILCTEATQAGMKHYPVNFYGKPLNYFTGALAFAQMLRQEKPHIVHCQMARIVPACAIVSKLVTPKTRIFYHARGLNPQTYPKISQLFKKLGVYIIANCQHERDKLIRHGFPANRITYTYNALPAIPNTINKTPHDFVQLATLSRLDKVRAVHLTLDAVKKLLDDNLPVRLQIAGIGEESEALKQQALALGIADKVTFLGAVRDLNTFFANTDILLNTLDCQGDHGAGVGNNILEAGLYRTAVVSYDVAGIREMVSDGITGFCTPWRDEAAFIHACKQLIQSPELRIQLGNALHQRVTELCSDDAIYRDTMQAYQMAFSS